MKNNRFICESTQEVKRYLIDKPYYIDIINSFSHETYEAWITGWDMGVSILMFAMPKAQQSYDDFCDSVADNLDEYILQYQNEIF